jgi:hypothetical protein
MSLPTMQHSGFNKKNPVRALDTRSTYFIKRFKPCSAVHNKASFSSHIQFSGTDGECVLQDRSEATFLPECKFGGNAISPLRFQSPVPSYSFRFIEGLAITKMKNPCLL